MKNIFIDNIEYSWLRNCLGGKIRNIFCWEYWIFFRKIIDILSYNTSFKLKWWFMFSVLSFPSSSLHTLMSDNDSSLRAKTLRDLIITSWTLLQTLRSSPWLLERQDRQDRQTGRTTGQTGQTGQNENELWFWMSRSLKTWNCQFDFRKKWLTSEMQKKLTIEFDMPGHFWRAAFSILAIFSQWCPRLSLTTTLQRRQGLQGRSQLSKHYQRHDLYGSMLPTYMLLSYMLLSYMLPSYILELYMLPS